MTTELALTDNPAAAAVVVLVTTTLLVIILSSCLVPHRNSTKQHNSSSNTIPWAPGAVPLLGHALRYKKDPSGFLLSTCQQVGNIFQLNMAGKHMYLVCGNKFQKQIASSPETICSARQAVADLGFEQTLGRRNVHQGTDLHKGIIKGLGWSSSSSSSTNSPRIWMESIQTAIRVEQQSQSQSSENVDWFPFIRRVILRATIEQMIGSAFLQSWDDFSFVTEFMSFQDTLEDVTAKAVVLPRWLAMPTMLLPLKRRRERLQQIIQKRLQVILSSNNDSLALGFWLDELKDKYQVEEIAEFVVGLLFAAHKNAAIGTAQGYIMLLDLKSKEDLNNCTREARVFLSNTNESNLLKDWSQLEQSCPNLLHLCLETLRLTAHSIGGVRKAQQDIVLGGYTIPKGATIGLSHICPNLQNNYWSDDPQTLDLQRNIDLYRDEYNYTTFSHGVHKCPGQKLALFIMECIIATLLVDYEIQLPKSLPPLSFERATLAQREGPIMVRIRPKESSS